MALLYLTLIFNGVCVSFFLFFSFGRVCGYDFTDVELPSSGACILAFLCNKPLQPKTSSIYTSICYLTLPLLKISLAQPLIFLVPSSR
ncbi:hypothetical protein I3843_04G147200 [Carya illinoinensis]|nr:hypothetical protein I3843_04G147200 [Carya illinoinensis]